MMKDDKKVIDEAFKVFNLIYGKVSGRYILSLMNLKASSSAKTEGSHRAGLFVVAGLALLGIPVWFLLRRIKQ